MEGFRGKVLFAAMTACCALEARSGKPEPIAVILDPGHTPEKGGAMSTRGIKEVVYNDGLASILADTLSARGMRVLLTRRPQDEVSLEDRVAVSRNNQARCFIALHHDSAQPKYLERADTGNAEVFSTVKPIQGYSVFVSAKNGQYRQSLTLAQGVGRSLLELGRKPTLHHAEPIQGENRPLLDSALGIYRYDDLIVLAKNPLPAVLIEYGVLVDKADEAYVSDPANQARFAHAVGGALEAYFRDASTPK
ncbi:MAG TPA: N-acetylmuramoyl-L-alanine amidase [Fibrobacteria bacterium]|nr:N-acetylmuramoyl-L-alanine amidase [Fibrobacteria bacterium]